MGGVRAFVRDKIPMSTDAYEHVRGRLKSQPTRRKVRELLASGDRIQLDLGGADAGRDGWLSVDITDECDLFWNLANGIPFPNASVDALYSSHLFEHLTFEQGQALLKECMRVLRPGSVFSICVPNARLYVEHYLGIRDLKDGFFGWAPAFHETTRIDALNYVAYLAGEHKYMFDEDNLRVILTKAGFVDVRARAFDPGTDRADRDHESIYAHGKKPG